MVRRVPKGFMRIFTGLSLPPQACSPVLTLIDQLRPLVTLVWTPAEKLHITTKFIGEWPEVRLVELQQALAGAMPTGPVIVRLGGLQWMSSALCAEAEMSGDLHQVTDRALEAIGVPSEKRTYRPHLTLARSRRPVDIAHTGFEAVPFHATAFHLYLSANGTYTKLSTYLLPT